MRRDSEDQRYLNRSLAKGLKILALFGTEAPWLSLSEIALSAGLDPATAFRLVWTLSSLGFLERSLTTKKFRPSLGVLMLGYAAIVASDLRELALPYLETLFNSTRHTVNMGVLKGAEVLYIERLRANELLISNVHVGTVLPAYCTSMGKVLLAHLPDPQLRETVRQIKFEKRGPRTITDPKTLTEELARIRISGFAVQDEELTEGLRSVAAPVWDRSGRAVAAINVAVASAHVSRRQLEKEIAPKVVATAKQISQVAGKPAVRAEPR